MRISYDFENEIGEYLSQWIQEDYWDDMAIMYSEGDIEMMASHMLGTGAIDSQNACLDDDQRRLEKGVECLGNRFERLSKKKQQARYDAVFKGTHLFGCLDCNHVSFVKDGNEKLYAKELQECWSCHSKNIEHSMWDDK